MQNQGFPLPIDTRPGRFLARAGRPGALGNAVRVRAGLLPAALRQVVRGRQDHLCYNAVDRWLPTQAEDPALIWCPPRWTANGSTRARMSMKRSTPPPPCSGTGRGTRRPRPAVHAHGAGGRLHHAGLRPHRRGAFGGVRRLRLGQPGAAHRRCRAQGDRVHRRRFARGQGRALQAAAGPGPGPVQDPAGRRGGVRPWAGALRAGGGRDLDYATLRARHQGARVPVAWLESSEPSYILYTSGTTGKPKGVQRDTGGYAVALASSMEYLFNGKPGDTYFCTSDIGWVVGHSYIIYGPLIGGQATILYEGTPVRPDGAILWKLVEKYRVNTLFSAPTAVRVLKRQDPALLKSTTCPAARRIPGRRTAGRAHRAMDLPGAGQAHHRQLLADRIGLADPVGPARRGKRADAFRQSLVPGVWL